MAVHTSQRRLAPNLAPSGGESADLCATARSEPKDLQETALASGSADSGTGSMLRAGAYCLRARWVIAALRRVSLMVSTIRGFVCGQESFAPVPTIVPSQTHDPAVQSPNRPTQLWQREDIAKKGGIPKARGSPGGTAGGRDSTVEAKCMTWSPGTNHTMESSESVGFPRVLDERNMS